MRLEVLPAGREEGREDVVNGWPGHYKNGTKLPTPTAAKEMSKKDTFKVNADRGHFYVSLVTYGWVIIRIGCVILRIATGSFHATFAIET